MSYAENIHKILDSNHHNPHGVLGYHEPHDSNGSAIRAFFPNAASMEVVFLDTHELFRMDKIREEGFFHVLFTTKKRQPYQFRLTNSHGHSWLQKDPYRHSSFLSEYDLYLFSEGNHHRLYQMLGAHPGTLDGVQGVKYAVWAPNARRVSVVGNFNDWDGRRNLMRSRGNSGVWELFIPDHFPGEMYKFEIKAHNGHLFQKTDPFGFQYELRPQNSAIVNDLNTYLWKDSAWMKSRGTKNGLEAPITIYELHLGSWMRIPGEEHRFLTYHEFADKLIPYVKWMGYTHIELLPLMEHPLDISWGYQVTGYYAPTSRFGTPQDFMFFVDRCHQEGLGVILDWVPAHFPKDAFSLAQFDGTCLYEHEDPRKGAHQDWGTLIFNYGRNEVRNFLIANALFWYDKYHLDGLRIDAVASMLYLDYSRKEGEWVPNAFGGRENLEAIDFMRHLNSILYRYYPDTMTSAEESTSFPGVSRPMFDGGLGFGFKWNMGWMHDFLNYATKEPVHRKYHHNELTFSMLYAFHENFILPLSHDEVVHGKKALLAKMPGDSWQKFSTLRLTYGFMMAHPGKKLLFMGGEFGQWSEWNSETSLDWHLNDYPPHQGLQRWVRDLNLLYKREPALFEVDFHHSGFEWIDCSDNDNSIVSFLRWAKEYRQFVIAVCNFTPVIRHDYRLGVPFCAHYVELLNSDAEIYGGSNQGNLGGRHSDDIPWMGRPHSISITLPPLSVLYFKM